MIVNAISHRFAFESFISQHIAISTVLESHCYRVHPSHSGPHSGTIRLLSQPRHWIEIKLSHKHGLQGPRQAYVTSYTNPWLDSYVNGNKRESKQLSQSTITAEPRSRDEFGFVQAADKSVIKSGRRLSYQQARGTSTEDDQAARLASLRQNWGYQFRGIHVVAGSTAASFLMRLVTAATGIQQISG